MLLAVLILCLLFTACRPIDHVRARLELKEGNKAYLAGNYNVAIAHYERVLAYVPDHAEAHRNSGYSLMALLRTTGDPDERCQMADRAVARLARLQEINAHARDERMPSRDQIDQYVLTLLLDSQQREKALAHLRTRIERNPRDVATMTMLSDICVDMEMLTEAIDWREKCLEIQSDRPEAYYAMGVFAWRLSSEDRITGEERQALLDRGLRALERVHELRGEQFEVLTFMNLLYREKAKHALADDTRSKFVGLAEHYENLARELFESGKQEARLLNSTSPDLQAQP